MTASRPKYFRTEELVDRETFRERGQRALELIDARVLITLDTLRETFGSTTVNNWVFGGGRHQSGLRHWSTGIGAKWSQHKFGRAMDCQFRDATPAEVYEYILSHRWKFPHITVLEDVAFTPTWLHFDVRWHDQRGYGDTGIWIVKP